MKNPKVLFLLEDDEVLIKALEEVFRLDGFEVHSFTTETEFRSALSGPLRPSVIVLDIMVPVARLTRENYDRVTKEAEEVKRQLEPAMSAGMRITRDLKKTDMYLSVKGVPIVFYTILNRDEYKMEAANLGVRYFVKGEHIVELLREFIIRITKDDV